MVTMTNTSHKLLKNKVLFEMSKYFMLDSVWETFWVFMEFLCKSTCLWSGRTVTSYGICIYAVLWFGHMYSPEYHLCKNEWKKEILFFETI